MRKLNVLLVLTLMVGIVPLTGAVVSAEGCPDISEVAPAPLEFGDPIYIDENKAGGEPVSIVAEDGSISVSAHAGTTHVYKNPDAIPGAGDFAVDYWNQTLNWRSTDGGETWDFIGLAGLPAGPHSATSTGFSDPDFTMDLGGRIYNVEIDLANVAVFSSDDDGQSYMLAHPLVSAGDRPWVTGGEADEVYLYINLPKQLWRSTTAGVAWTLLPTPPINAKAYRDPRNPKSGLIGPVGKNAIAISDNKGQSWTTFSGANLGNDVNFFGVSAVDNAGHVYKAAAGGYNGTVNSNPNSGEVTFNYFDRDTKEWGQRVHIPRPKGAALWPWVIAGDDGRVAVTWYQTLEGKPGDEIYAFVAYTTNGRGTWVECDDGTEKFIPPQFSTANAAGRPIHKGAICLSGTTCNANPNFVAGDRRLGDFFTVNFDHEGTIFIATGDTMLENPLGGPKPVANPLFVKQSAGDKLLEEPMEPRDTRCKFNLPTC